MGPKRIIYVSSSVTNAPKPYRDFIKKFKQELRTATASLVIEWLDQDAPMLPHDFFRKNLNNVLNSDAMIAIANEPSIGVGMEIQEAIRNQKPLLCLYEQGRTISRLLMAAKEAGEVRLETYQDMNHAIELASDFINSLGRENIQLL